MFPGCDSDHIIRPPCREACVIMRDDFCLQQWDTVVKLNDDFSEPLKIPVCERYPSLMSNTTCAYPNVITGKDCFIHIKVIFIL